MTAGAMPRSSLAFKLLLIFISAIVVIAIFYGINVWLNWTVFQYMYSSKAGINWASTVFYHGYTFVVAAILALLVINPVPGHSDILSAISAVSSRAWSIPREPRFRTYSDYRFYTPGQSVPQAPQGEFRMSLRLWGIWQGIKYVFAYLLFAGLAGLPIFGNIAMPALMMTEGYGSWAMVPRIMALPFDFAPAQQIIALIPTMQIQYFLIYSVIGGIIVILMVRLVIRAIRDFAKSAGNNWIRDIVLFFSCLLGIFILGAPYWLMNAASPYAYGTLWCLLLFTFVGWLYLKLSGKGVIPITARRRKLITAAAIVVAMLLLFNVGFSAYIYINWNNRWPDYEWAPAIQKQIVVTDWTSGVQNLQVLSLQQLPTGNASSVLSLVRQWGQDQAYKTMTKELGAVNWMAPASAQIVWYNNTEYWVAPATIQYPPNFQSWISQHLFVTHADRVIVINTHTGQEVTTQQAFGAPEPLIYYGENLSFRNDVYVHVKGYEEINNETFPGTPDYVLSGYQRALWFLLRGQLGFAFSPPQDSIDMLHNRNIFDRVGEILIAGLKVDPSAYMVSDGHKLYYAVQVYVSYNLNTGFSQSPYLRFFGVVLIDPTNGSMQGYFAPNQNFSDNFLMSFYKGYYSSWKPAPQWLVSQLRYPEALLGTPSTPGQLDYNFFFHVTDPTQWRSGSNFYELPTDQNGNPVNSVLYLAYSIGNKSYFVGLQEVEYYHSASKNLAGIYIVFGGDRLGQMYLYQTPSSFNGTIIGPSAALQTIQSYPTIRTLQTLLPTNQLGSVLLYVINGHLYYFVPFYVTPQGPSQVIVQLPYMIAVDPFTQKVGIGADSAAAYYSLLGQGSQPVSQLSSLQANITSYFRSKGFTVLNATQVNANVFVQVGNVSYISSADWPNVQDALNSFIQNYASQYQSSLIIAAPQGNSSYTYGILVQKMASSQPPTNILILYYVTVQFGGG
jgi:Uncharacterized conserved protein, COG1615